MLGRPPSLLRAALESSESNLWLMTETFFLCFGDPLSLRTEIRIDNKDIDKKIYIKKTPQH